MNRILSWLGSLAQRFKDQPAKVDLDTMILSQTSPFTVHAPAPPVHNAILASRRQAILFRQIVPPNHDPAHLSFFGGEQSAISFGRGFRARLAHRSAHDLCE